MAPAKQSFKIYQGSTFTEVLRWESSTMVYKPITGITKAAPMVITAVSHGVPAGWRCKISNVGGMKELNTDDYLTATITTTDSLTFNAVNSLGYTAYTSGGIVEYNDPVSLSGYSARMQLRSKVTSTDIILELTTVNGMIVIDNTAKTITLNIPAATTTTLDFKSAVYSLEMVSGTTVVPLITGTITLEPEVTR